LAALKQVESGRHLALREKFTGALHAYFSVAVSLFAGSASAEEAMPPASLVPEQWSNILLVFFALMCAAAVWFVWRRSKVASTGLDYRLQLVGGISFGTKERLVMVKIKDRILLLGVTAHQINLIKELPEADFLISGSLPAAEDGHISTANTNNAVNNRPAKP
jgi:flagellar protein FliO/FliZ